MSRAALFPKHRADVLHTAIVTERMLAGQIEAISIPQNPLDILAQQTVAASALEPLDVEGWYESLKRSAPFRSLPRSAYEATLDLLAGRFPSDEFAELRPRLVWDRDHGTLTGRPGSQRIAVTSGGTIPDRGLFGVFIAGESQNARVGELDEEMVYESRVNDVFTLGTTSWRIVEITHDRVNVLPAFGQPGKVPFWHGDGIGRPAELGEALGRFSRELSSAKPDAAQARLHEAGLDALAQSNLLSYLAEQREATGTLPSDKNLTVERGRDEVGDWRIILHSPYGMKVHAPWALAVNARIRERLGVEGSAVASDDGVIARVPDATAEPPGAELFVFDPDELEQIVTDEVGGSALFASRFRECAARALLLPRRNPGRRSPLWQQRQRSAQLLEVARRYPTFPIILETLREVLQDVYDVPALLRIARGIGDRRIRLIETEPAQPSPFARDLLFGYVGAFMYEGDSPLAERRAAALSVDPALLSELLGKIELRELLDPAIIVQYERELQRLDPERRARGVEGVADLLRMLGPLDAAEVAARLLPSESGEATPEDAARTARRARHGAARDRRHDRGRAALRGDRGRRPPARRARGRAPRRHPDRLRRARRGPARRPRGPVRADARSLHGGCRGHPPRRRHRGRPAHAAAARIAGPRRERVLPSGGRERFGRRGRVVRFRSPAAPAPAIARGDPGQRRTGLGRGVCPLPPRLAARRDGRSRASTASRRSSSSSPASRSPRARGSRSSCPRAWRTTRPRCSTSSRRRARSSGRATARSRAATAGSPCIPPTPRRSRSLLRATRSHPGRSKTSCCTRCRPGARTSRRS